MSIDFKRIAETCNILVAVPCQEGKLHAETAKGLLDFKVVCQAAKIENEISFTVNEALISRARNGYLDEFLDNPAYTHLMFIDSDMQFDGADIFKLISRDKDIISAACPKKVFPLSPACSFVSSSTDESKINRDETGELLEAGHAGTAFMLIKKEVINSMGKINLFNPIEGDPSGGEDNAFCKRWKKTGGKIWIDPTIKIGHIGRYIYEFPHSAFDEL